MSLYGSSDALMIDGSVLHFSRRLKVHSAELTVEISLGVGGRGFDLVERFLTESDVGVDDVLEA